MALITPKTDWVATDYINYSDYNRICNNLDWIKTEASTIGIDIDEWTTMTVATGYSDIPYADMFNDIVDNYNQLENIYYGFQPVSDVYTVNGSTITYVTLNIIEQAIELLDEVISVAHDNIPRLAITLGGNNKLKI
jgi:hypothetical protein